MRMRVLRVRLLSVLAACGVAAGMIVTAAPALAVTCPTVDSSTGAVSPAPTAGVDWSGCDLSNAYLPNADLDGANLSGATMTHATVAGANLTNADLSSADLLGTYLQGADLTSANLDSAYAWGANFTGAMLKGASLQGTDIDSADLGSANLFGATGQIASDVGTSWISTICPNGANANYYTAGCFSAVAVTTPSATPTITGGTLGTNGWYTSGVTVSWYWVDSQNMDPASCAPTTTDATEGSVVTISGSCTDALSITGTASKVVKIDSAPPVVTLTGLRDNGTYMLGKQPFPQCTTADALSGVALHAGTSITGGQPDGSGVFTVTCTNGQDIAGNVAAPITAHYTMVYEFGGFLAPKVGATLKSTAKIISVRFRLTDENATPIGATYAAALAAHHDVIATLRGPGISPAVATCRWNSTGQFFGCPIATPPHVETGKSHQYTITVKENLGSGFVKAPPNAYSENPEPVYFG